MISEGGLHAIIAERWRQRCDEHWTPEHDDEHRAGELAWAAVCYAAPGPVRGQRTIALPCNCAPGAECIHRYFPSSIWSDPWPWSKEWDKRSKHDRIKQLAIAGALIAAEIDRLKRAEIREASSGEE